MPGKLNHSYIHTYRDRETYRQTDRQTKKHTWKCLFPVSFLNIKRKLSTTLATMKHYKKVFLMEQFLESFFLFILIFSQTNSMGSKRKRSSRHRLLVFYFAHTLKNWNWHVAAFFQMIIREIPHTLRRLTAKFSWAMSS